MGPLYDKWHRIHCHPRKKKLAHFYFFFKLRASTCMSSLINSPKKNMKTEIF